MAVATPPRKVSDVLRTTAVIVTACFAKSSSMMRRHVCPDRSLSHIHPKKLRHTNTNSVAMIVKVAAYAPIRWNVERVSRIEDTFSLGSCISEPGEPDDTASVTIVGASEAGAEATASLPVCSGPVGCWFPDSELTRLDSVSCYQFLAHKRGRALPSVECLPSGDRSAFPASCDVEGDRCSVS